jgi:hypothetical protein
MGYVAIEIELLFMNQDKKCSENYTCFYRTPIRLQPDGHKNDRHVSQAASLFKTLKLHHSLLLARNTLKFVVLLTLSSLNFFTMHEGMKNLLTMP